jgi:hypothetical protein
MVELVARAIADRRGSDIIQWFHRGDAKAAVAAMNAASGADRMREALERIADFPAIPTAAINMRDIARQALGEPQ